jgi:hypothetical protein
MDAKQSAAPEESADPFVYYRRVGSVAAFLFLLIAANQLWQNFVHPSCRDFISFWGAARLAIAGSPALAYNLNALHHLQSSIVNFGPGEQLPFPYPPAFLLLVLPFGLFSYPVGMALWVAATLGLYFAAMKRLTPDAGLLALAFPPVFVNILIGQNGFLTAALFCAAFATLDRRPFVAGLLAGCIVLKPQLGVFFPVALLASRQWRAIAGAAVSSICLGLLSLFLFGSDTFLAWARQLPLYGAIAKNGNVGWIQFTSVYAAARQVGLGSVPAMLLHSTIAIIAAAFVWNVWRSRQDNLAKTAVLAAATALASPYLFLYDLLILAIPFLWLAKAKANPAAVGGIWCMWMASIAQHFGSAGPINLNPIIPISLLTLTLWQQHKGVTGRPLPDIDVTSLSPTTDPA